MDLMDKKLLVLGGIAQVCDIVEDAQNKGISVTVTDYLTDSPAKRIADENAMISITDVDAIVDYAIEHKVDGVINYCIDPGQKPYQAVCERLNLPCYGTKEQFSILTNKDLFKDYCIKNGVDVVESYIVDDNFLTSEIKNIEYPVIIKPADGRASKGITLCYTKSEVLEAVDYALIFSDRKKILCERYMLKPEVAVKYFVCDGHIYLTSMSDIYTSFSNGKRDYIWTQIFPSKFYSVFKEYTDKRLRQLIRKLGIKNGPLSFSGFVDGEKFRFIDPSFRMGGAQDWRIVNHITGINISEMMTNYALTGKMIDNPIINDFDGEFSKKSSAMLYFLAKEGKIHRIDGLDKAILHEDVIGYHICHEEGSTIKDKYTADQVVMRILIVSDDVVQLKKAIKYIQSIIEVTDELGNSLLLPNFDVNLI